jgi:preprotein translocase subunit SecG
MDFLLFAFLMVIVVGIAFVWIQQQQQGGSTLWKGKRSSVFTPIGKRSSRDSQ